MLIPSTAMYRAKLILLCALCGVAPPALLTACSKTVDTACTAFVPISYSASQDTESTVTQVRQHNAAWSALCK